MYLIAVSYHWYYYYYYILYKIALWYFSVLYREH